MPIDECRSCPSTKRSLFTQQIETKTNNNNNKIRQPTTGQNAEDKRSCECQSTSPASRGSGNLADDGMERLQEPEDHEVSCEIISPRNDRDEFSTAWLPTWNMNKGHANREGGNLMGSQPQQRRQAVKESWDEERIVSPTGYSISNGQPWNYILQLIWYGLRRLYLQI